MSRHQRLQRTLRSPVRRRNLRRSRIMRQAVRAINDMFGTGVTPVLPDGFSFRLVAVRKSTPQQRFRALRKAARRDRRAAA